MKKSLLITFLTLAGVVLCGCQGGGDSSSSPTQGSSTSQPDSSITSLSITFENPVTETGYDAVLNIKDKIVLKYAYLPNDATKTSIKWTYDKNVCSILTTSSEKKATITATAAGECEIYGTIDGFKSNVVKIKIKDTGYKQNSDFSKAATTYGNNALPLNRNTFYTNSNDPHLDSLKEQHVLVVPFGFSDCTSKQTDFNLDRIVKTFTGTPEDFKGLDAWVSVQDFYNTSSYGKCKFEVSVVPTWCNYGGTSADFTRAASQGLGVHAANYARTWYISEYNKANHGALGADAHPITYFDANGDGYIDLTWIVYSHDIDHDNDFWAYVTYTGNGSNVAQPTVKTLGWASIDFMSKGCNGYDPHTFIHETGHTFGLDDYYDYKNTWSPMGGIDFMDHNVCDHSMYSKFSLGWTSPYVVNDNAVITLHPGTSTGDCFIIPSPGYNGTAFDEYMMFELMAPVGISEHDCLHEFEGTHGFTVPGIRITHVDARVTTGNHDTYLTENVETGKTLRIGNSYGGRSGIRVDGDYFPIVTKDNKGKETIEKRMMAHFSLIESTIKDKNVTNSYPYTADNSALFTAGQSFTLKSGRNWDEVYMPSKSNLWNKAKTTTGWAGDVMQYTIDETCTFNYSIKVLSIEKNDQYGYEAKVQVNANDY